MSKISEIKRIHFIGGGGISVSALAKLMLIEGKRVSASDLNYTDELCTLSEWGAEIWAGHNTEGMRDAELVVYSSAVPKTDEELSFAVANGIEIMERQWFLREICSDYRKVIAIGGTHGKTTVTGMTASIFRTADMEFTAHIGGCLKDFGNLIFRGREYIITEACEYKKNLLVLEPTTAVVLNAEKDHPDTFISLGDIYETFDQFLYSDIDKESPQNKIVSYESEYYQKHLYGKEGLITFGLEGADYSISGISEYKKGHYRFHISKFGVLEEEVSLPVPGWHNMMNAVAAYAIASVSGVEKSFIKAGLESYPGIKRRFEKRGAFRGADIYSDYAHHPSEILAALRTAKSVSEGGVKAVFQPHTYSRTAEFFEDFIKVLEIADTVYIFKEYPSRETPDRGLSALDLYKGLREKTGGTKGVYFDNLLTLAQSIKDSLNRKDTLIVMGAGDIDILPSLIID